MRIVFDPIIVNADGLSIEDSNDHRAVLLYLDPKKLTPQGVRESLEYATTERAVNTLAGFGTADPATVTDHIITGMISAPFHDEYRNTVIAHAGTERARPQIDRFLQARLHQTEANPEALVAAAKEALAIPVPEWRRSTRPDPTAEMKDGYKVKLQAAINNLPDYLKGPMRHEKMNIICAKTIMNFMPIEAAVTMPDSNTIGIIYEYLEKCDIPRLTIAIKEEALHYFSVKMGFTERKDFVAAAEALLKNDAKMAAIDALCEQVHGPEGVGKARVRNYPHHQKDELFVEYFHIRDLLEARAQPGSFAGALKGEAAPSKVDAQMQSLFGDEIHRICKEFEAEMIRRNSELPVRKVGG